MRVGVRGGLRWVLGALLTASLPTAPAWAEEPQAPLGQPPAGEVQPAEAVPPDLPLPVAKAEEPPAESAAPAPPAEPPPPAPPAPPAESVVAPSGAAGLSSEEWWNRALGLHRSPLPRAPKAPVRCWSGDVLVRARSRTTGDESDNDLYQYLRVRYRREDAPGWSGSFYMRLSEDLDGLGSSDEFFVFDSIDDTYDTAVLARLYHLYASYYACGGFLEQLRIGRQDIVAGDVFHVDAVHATLRPVPGSSARVTAFAGIPTHLYESSIEGDVIVGGSVWFKPWRGASLEIADAWFQDENEVYGEPEVNLATVQLTQRLGCWGNLIAGYQQLDLDPRVAWGTFNGTWPRHDVAVRGSVRTQILAEKETVYDLDPYYAILLELEPYWEAQLSVSKGLGRVWAVELGGQVRSLYDDDDVGDFNHEFARLYGTLSARDWGASGWSVALTGEWYSTDDGEDIGAAGFEVERRRGCWRWTGGIDYALYRTDIYAVEERFDSYGAYLRVRYRPRNRWELDGSLRVDEDDFDTYVTLNLALRYEF